MKLGVIPNAGTKRMTRKLVVDLDGTLIYSALTRVFKSL